MKLFIIMSIVLFGVGLYGQITLEDCVDAGLKNSGLIRQAEMDRKSAAMSLRSSRTDFLPDITASTQSNYGKSGNWLLAKTLSVSQNLDLFDERYYSLKAAQIEEEISTLDLREKQRELVLEIVQIYTELLILKKERMVHNRSLEIYEVEESYLQEMLKSGVKNELDLYSVQIEMQNALLQIKRTERDIATNLNELERIVGFQPDIDALQDYFINIPDSIPKKPEYNYDVQLATHQVELSENALKRSFANLLPRLSLEGIYQWSDIDYLKDSNDNYETVGNQIDSVMRNSDWTVALTLSYPLGDYFSRRSKHAIAKYQSRKREIHYNETMKETNNKMSEFLLDISLKQDELEIHQQKNELAVKKYELAKARYRSGIVDFLEFNNAENEKAKSEIELHKTNYELMMTYLRYQVYSGEEVLGIY